MKTLIAAIALAVFVFGEASATDKTDAMAVARKWADSITKVDGDGGSSYCADVALVLDDFAPHVWQGPGACTNWYRDYEAFVAKWQVTAASVALGKFRHVDIESGHAYLVVPVTLTYKKVGKPKMEKGIVTMSLKKGDSGWQITGWAWADL